MVKAFNAIQWMRLRDDGRPAGDPERLGIPISGDDEEAKRTVAELIDQIGFDPVDAGTLAQGGRKHQTGAPAYTQGLPTAELRARLSPPEQKTRVLEFGVDLRGLGGLQTPTFGTSPRWPMSRFDAVSTP